MSAPFALPAELDAYQAGAADQALDLATAAIRAYCRWSITAEDGVVFTVPVSRSTVILPTLYLRAVTAVDPDLAEIDGVSISPAGVVSGLYPFAVGSTLTYDHGYPEAPAEIKLVAFEVATRLQDTGGDGSVVQTMIGGFSEMRQQSGSLFSDDQRAILNRYRLPRLP